VQDKNMKRLLFIYLFSVIAGSLMAQPCHEVVGYYASWKWYDRDKLVNPETIDYSKYTVLNYAFFKPQVDGTITYGDSWADQNLLGKPYRYNSGNTLIRHAHSNGVKVFVSVGGWTWSEPFPVIAARADLRNKFAEECARIIREHDLDGIDIDWEYPGFVKHGGSPSDRDNFTLLLKAVRLELDRLEVISGKDLHLTFASGIAAEHMSNIDWDQVVPLVDFINLMTYNYSGTWDNTTGHNSPLFCNDNSPLCVNGSVEMLLNEFGVPASKVTLGMAFYARTACTTAKPGLRVNSLKKADVSTFSSDMGVPEYYNLGYKSHLFDVRWDWDAKVPYMTGKNDLKSFITYDDPVSIGIKAGYVLHKGLRGAAIWEVSGDYVESWKGSGVIVSTPLASALNKVFCTPDPDFIAQHFKDQEKGPQLSSFLFSEYMLIDFTEAGGVTGLRIMDASGKVVAEVANPLTEELSLDTSQWEEGLYFVQWQMGDRVKLARAFKI
jgi:chitinase